VQVCVNDPLDFNDLIKKAITAAKAVRLEESGDANYIYLSTEITQLKALLQQQMNNTAIGIILLAAPPLEAPNNW